MGAATVLYEGSVQDTAGIIAGMGTNAASTMIFVSTCNGQGLLIMLQGAP